MTSLLPNLPTPIAQLRAHWARYRPHANRGESNRPRIRIVRMPTKDPLGNGLYLFAGLPLLRVVASKVVIREREGHQPRPTEYLWLEDIDGVLWKGGAKPRASTLIVSANYVQRLPQRWADDMLDNPAPWPAITLAAIEAEKEVKL